MKSNHAIKGLYYGANVISEEHSRAIIKKLDYNKWTIVDPYNETKIPVADRSRLVQQFGFYFNYKTYDVAKIAPDFPDFIEELKNILLAKCKELNLIDDKYKFNQCIVNNYFKSEGISQHTDSSNFGPVIGCFTIGSGAKIIFKNRDQVNEIYTENCSLYIMSSDARQIYTHQMDHVTEDNVNGNVIPRRRRISITFRDKKE